MAQDTLIVAENITAIGTLTSVTGSISGTQTVATGSMTTANITTANLTNAVTTNQYGGVSATTGVALTTSGTIAYARVSKVNPGSAVTAVIMAAGTQDGQELTIMNVAQAAGSSVTFATAGSAAASSHLATDFVISGLTCAKYVWDGTTAVWYPVVN